MSAPHASPNPSPHLLVIDAQSLAARAAHVAGDDAVAGVRLWCQMARGTALDVQASHVVAAWDHDGPTFRHALFPSYKHRRTGSTRAKVAPIRAALETAGLVSLSVEGFEGDDVVASVMAMYHADLPVTLLSNDSDLLQFVSERVQVVSYVGMGKGTDGLRVRKWAAADVHTRFGVTPAQLPDFKAMCGEDGDDIPGIARIGKDTAAKLLRRWQSLEKALEASEFVSHRDVTAKLAGQHEHARLMRQLTTIRTDAPVPPFSLGDCALDVIAWPTGTQARMSAAPGAGGTVSRSAAGPGLEDIPWPDAP
jgi:DNA polymerase-1